MNMRYKIVPSIFQYHIYAAYIASGRDMIPIDVKVKVQGHTNQ